MKFDGLHDTSSPTRPPPHVRVLWRETAVTTPASVILRVSFASARNGNVGTQRNKDVVVAAGSGRLKDESVPRSPPWIHLRRPSPSEFARLMDVEGRQGSSGNATPDEAVAMIRPTRVARVAKREGLAHVARHATHDRLAARAPSPVRPDVGPRRGPPGAPLPWRARELPARTLRHFLPILAHLGLLLAVFKVYRIEGRAFQMLVTLALAALPVHYLAALPLEEAVLRGRLDRSGWPGSSAPPRRPACWPSPRP